MKKTCYEYKLDWGSQSYVTVEPHGKTKRILLGWFVLSLASYVGDMCICRQFLANIACQSNTERAPTAVFCDVNCRHLTKPTANHHAAAEEEEDRQWHYSRRSIGRRRGRQAPRRHWRPPRQHRHLPVGECQRNCLMQ